MIVADTLWGYLEGGISWSVVHIRSIRRVMRRRRRHCRIG